MIDLTTITNIIYMNIIQEHSYSRIANRLSVNKNSVCKYVNAAKDKIDNLEDIREKAKTLSYDEVYCLLESKCIPLLNNSTTRKKTVLTPDTFQLILDIQKKLGMSSAQKIYTYLNSEHHDIKVSQSSIYNVIKKY